MARACSQCLLLWVIRAASFAPPRPLRCGLSCAASHGEQELSSLRTDVAAWEQKVAGLEVDVAAAKAALEASRARLDAAEALRTAEPPEPAAKKTRAGDLLEKAAAAEPDEPLSEACAAEETPSEECAAEARFRRSAAARRELEADAALRSAARREARGGTHYELLGVGRDATDDGIRAAYRAAAAASHPDAATADAARFAAARAAYDVLRDPKRRADYDGELGLEDLVDGTVSFVRDAAVPFVRDAAGSIANATSSFFADDADERDARGRWARALRRATRAEHMITPSPGKRLAVDRNGTGLAMVGAGLGRLLARDEATVRRIEALKTAAADGPTLTLAFADDEPLALLFVDDGAAADAEAALRDTVRELAAIREADASAARTKAVTDGLGGLAVAGAGALVVAGIVEAETAIAAGTAAAAVLGTVASVAFGPLAAKGDAKEEG